MKLLIVGAGALGGYFGGRLLEAGVDVTFLLRPRRAAELQRTGLVVKSRFGDLALPPPPYLLAEQLDRPFDVVLVGCKAFDLESTMTAFAPAVGPGTAVVPLLNGMRHLDVLEARFGASAVLGGQCMISASLDADGAVLHLNDTHTLAFGERGGGGGAEPRSARVERIAALFSRASFDTQAVGDIVQQMWEKWVFIASAAGITCLMRASIGDIVGAGAGALALRLLDECAAIAARNGHPPRPAALERGRAVLTAPGSPMTASMFKDIDKDAPIEADHIVGDLLRRWPGGDGEVALLRIVDAHLKVYEARRARELQAAAAG